MPIPLKGDRATRFVKDYPNLHADDIESGEYLYHLPATSGSPSAGEMPIVGEDGYWTTIGVDEISSGSPGGGASDFTDLGDVPSSYTSQSLKLVRVNVGETGLEFTDPSAGGVDDFTDLGDVPNAYTGEAGKLLAVTSEENGLEFVNVPTSGSGGGDMYKSVYDPNEVEDDAFDMTNMVEGTTNKIFTATERSKLSGIESGADVTDADNVASAGAAMAGGAFHDGFSDFVANEHIDWSASSAGTIHTSNYIEGGPGTDTTAIHDNESGEINALTEKTTPHDNDLIIIEDSEASNVKKKLKVSNLPSGGGTTDTDAIHDNAANEISAITEKTTLHDNDLILIEDSEASNVKKRVKISNLPASGGGGTVAYTHFDPDAPPDTASSFDDEFDDYELDGKWSQIVVTYTSSSSTYSTPDLDTVENEFGFIFKPIGIYSDGIQGFVQYYDTDNGDTLLVTMKVAKSGETGEIGILLGNEDGNDPQLTFSIKWTDFALNALVQNWSNWNTKSGAALANVSIGSGFSHYYLRIFMRDNGSGTLLYTYMVSQDGVHWSEIYSGSVSVSYCFIGFYCNVDSSVGDMQSYVEFFRVDEDPTSGGFLTNNFQFISYGKGLNVLT